MNEFPSDDLLNFLIAASTIDFGMLLTCCTLISSKCSTEIQSLAKLRLLGFKAYTILT